MNKKLKKILKGLGLLIVIFLVLYSLFILAALNSNKIVWLSRISAGDAGPYKEGDVVLTVPRKWANSPIRKGQIVIFKTTDNFTVWVGEVIGLQGDQITNKTTEAPSLSGKIVTGLVPNGMYLIRVGNNMTISHLISSDQIEKVVLFQKQ